MAWVLVGGTLVGCGDDVPDDDVGGTADSGAAASTGASSSEGPAADSSDDDDEPADSSGGTTGAPEQPDPLPPLSAAPLTTEETLVTVLPAPAERIGDPRIPEEIVSLLADGHGDFELAEGEPIIDVTQTGDSPTPPGPNAQLLTRFVHLADSQLADDESPTRVIGLDDFAGGGFRPAETYGCHVLDAAVRTINRVHEDLPLDFVVLGGDNTDSAQGNELAWFLGVMDGLGPLHCDSGDDNDPEPGEGNDPKDPFTPVGLDVPWLWVTGNHDTLVQGNFLIASRLEAAIGTIAAGGTRDWTQPGGPAVTGSVPADPARALGTQTAILTAVAASGDGHGIDDDVIARGEADYTFDVEGSDIRLIVLDTTAFEAGGSEGLLLDAEVDSFLRPALDTAEADSKRVILVSHHASGSLASASDDAVGTTDFRLLLGEYDNVLMHLCGHSHQHSATLVEPMGGTPYWEVITSALMDYPNQMRVIEVHDQDNGEYRIQMVAFDFQADDDPMGEAARALLVLDYTTGWDPADAPGDLEDRNVSLYVPVP